ncbi:MAG: J domain-containing protein, partial [Gemmatimonadales bacterium]
MNPDPLIWNPYAVLGLPEWPDLDDETVRAAWQQIADETHPDRADGGDLARYTRATAAYNDLCCPWGRTEAYADLVDQAQRDGRWDAYPDPY